jgi:cation:H+ antiporter
MSELFQDFSYWVLFFGFGVGIAGLTAGGDWVCRGAVGLAAFLRVKPLIIGLTVVSAATSMPEFFISLLGSLRGSYGLSIGNILGSNIANIGLILGLSALICPLVIRVRLIRIDVPILIAVSALFALLCWTSLSRIDGVLLLAVLIVYLFFLVRASRREEMVVPGIEEVIRDEIRGLSLGRSLLWLGLGTVALALAAGLLVQSSVEIAGRMGVSEVLIGLTVVAIGTSLPEFAASIAAAIRKQADLCAGNIVGSNLFNLILVSGSVSVISPIGIDRNLFLVEFPAMLFFAFLLWPLIFTGKIVSRLEGVLLLLFYGAFLTLSAVFHLGWLSTAL